MSDLIIGVFSSWAVNNASFKEILVRQSSKHDLTSILREQSVKVTASEYKMRVLGVCDEMSEL